MVGSLLEADWGLGGHVGLVHVYLWMGGQCLPVARALVGQPFDPVNHLTCLNSVSYNNNEFHDK